MSFNILIVDDSREFRKMIRNYIESHELGLNILEAASAESALMLAQEHPPQIVLMDVWLPRLNGIEAAKRIKERYSECEIIIITMLGTEGFLKDLRCHNFRAFVSKSEVYDQLMPILKLCLRKAGEAV